MDAAAKKLDELFTLITGARHCVALTGAGVSTLSGIRDFRGKNGLYKEMDAEKIFDLQYFFRDPSFYYQHAASFIYDLEGKEASVVHTVLGDLEKRGYLKAVITQNIDLLHTKGGSRRVIEVHGSPAVHYCPRCDGSVPESPPAKGTVMGFDEAAALVRAGDMPRCSVCGVHFFLKNNGVVIGNPRNRIIFEGGLNFRLNDHGV